MPEKILDRLRACAVYMDRVRCEKGFDLPSYCICLHNNNGFWG